MIEIEDFDILVEEKLNRILDEATSQTVMKNLGEVIKKKIIKRVKAGYGCAEDGSLLSILKPLAESTIASRRKKKLHKSTTASKSNLTETGKMLNSLVVSVSDNTITISCGEKLKHKYTSEERPWFHMSEKEIDQVVEDLELVVKKIIKQEKKQSGK